MKISIVIPCFNEMGTIGTVLKRISDLSMVWEREVIVVDDGSTDGTREYLKGFEHKDRHIRVIYHSENQGKGAALRTGFTSVSGDIVIIQDADMEYDPNDYPKLLKPIFDGNADVVYGTRFVGSDSHRVLYFWHSLGNKFLTLLCNMVTNLNLTDMEVCYKVFRRDILSQIQLKENRFGFEPEITIKLSRLNARIYEVGISYFGRTYKEGKKINWKDGLRAIYVILKYGLLRR